MKFIIPQNYNTSSKLFGFLDYSSGIIMLLWSIFIYCLINFIFKSFYIKITIFIIFCFPIYILCLVGLNHENIIYVLSYILKFILSQKIYLFQKYI